MVADHGKQAIGKLRVGEKVLAYNPKTHKMEMEPILHVWIHKDSDLVDLTITTNTHAPHSTKVTKTQEVLHTNQKHPFFTLEKGFVPVGHLKLGMHVLRADGQIGVITGWKIVPGTKVMYNLEVAHDHTFVVGQGQWVVHNRCDPGQLKDNMRRVGVTFFPYQNPHHVIPCSVQNHALIGATNGLFNINAAYNGRVLWDYDHRNEAFAAMEPYHANSPRYARYAKSLMDAEYQRLSSSGNLNPQAAFNSLLGIIAQLNGWIDTIGWFQSISGNGDTWPLCGLP